MKKTIGHLFHSVIILLLLLSLPLNVWGDDGDVLSRKIELPNTKGTIYQLLQEVSQSSGYLFIYDSQIIDNDKIVKIPKHQYTIQEAIYAITKNPQLKIKIVDNHILLYLSTESDKKATKIVEDRINDYFTITGSLRDRITNEYLPYAAISVDNIGIGTIANQDGYFKLILPDSLHDSYIKFSHLGYQTEEIAASLLAEQNTVLYLEPKVVPLQEVVVRVVNPLEVLNEMILNREQNYSLSPVQMTAFYREGINHKKKNINITEAVLAVYKTGIQNSAKSDQVKLLKMRRLIDQQEADTLLPKMKSGINSCLLLDVMKVEIPDFLTPNQNPRYTYTHTDITTLDGRRVNVISFEPREGEDVLYRGELYIDAENQALLQVNFEIRPDYIREATSMFILKKDKTFNIEAQRIRYTVSYKPLNRIYYVNHIRGDLYFKVKRKKRLFSSTLHMWFEMVNCQTDVTDATPFAKKEKISTDDIFSDKSFDYDVGFWGNFNTIMLEEDLRESIVRILEKNK